MPPDRPDLALYLRCFRDVSNDRSFNGTLTFSAVARWCEVYGQSVSEYWQVLRIADDEVVKWRRLRSK